MGISARFTVSSVQFTDELRISIGNCLGFPFAVDRHGRVFDGQGESKGALADFLQVPARTNTDLPKPILPSIAGTVTALPRGNVVAQDPDGPLQLRSLGEIRVIRDALVTPLGYHVNRLEMTRVLEEVFATPQRFVNVVSKHTELPLARELGRYPSFEAMARALFTFEDYQALIDPVLEMLVTNYPRPETRNLRYSSFDVSYSSRQVAGDYLVSLATRIAEASFTAKDPGKVARIIHQDGEQVLLDWDKLLLITALQDIIDRNSTTKGRLNRLRVAIDFLSADLKGRTIQYRRELGGQTRRQLVIEKVIGEICCGIAPATEYLRLKDSGHLDVAALAIGAQLSPREKMMIAAEVRSRAARGYVDREIADGILEKRLSALLK